MTLIMALTLTLGLAAAASADSISWQGWQQKGLRIDYKQGNANKSTSLIGSFDIGWDEGESLTAYCVDLLTGGVGGAYDVTELSLLDSEAYSSLYQAAWIMDNYSRNWVTRWKATTTARWPPPYNPPCGP